MSVQEKVISKIKTANARFHGNDNIAEFLEDGDLDLIISAVADKFTDVFREMIIDIDNDHNMKDTARRVAKMYVNEFFVGRYTPMPKITSFPNDTKLDEMITVGPIKSISNCSHHLAKIYANTWIGLLPKPNADVIGLSKFARLTDWVLQRPQIQEEAVKQLSELISSIVDLNGLAVYMEAKHTCMSDRGPRKEDALMGTCVLTGAFKIDPSAKDEFLAFVKNTRKSN